MSRGTGGELQRGRLLSTGGLGSFWKPPLTSGELRFFLRRSISAQKEDCALRALSQPWVRRVPWALPLPDVGGLLFLAALTLPWLRSILGALALALPQGVDCP